MGFEDLQQLLLIYTLLGTYYRSNDMAMGNRSVNQNTGCIDMGHDGHQIFSLMAGRVIYLQCIGKTAMVIAGVGYTANDGHGGFLDPDRPVDGIDGTD